ncbi:MAG: hypothetical protein K6G55_01320 [Selenomonadaceae bacterium]|nr:hypothetical protein [Selenomonadaceae bacterium]
MSVKLNTNVKERDEIIFGSYDESHYLHEGIRDFSNLPIEALEKLFELNFVDPDAKHNTAPSSKEFFDFVKKYPRYTVQGFATSTNRSYYGVFFTGVEKEGDLDNLDELADFAKLFGHADELHAENLYCWFD